MTVVYSNLLVRERCWLDQLIQKMLANTQALRPAGASHAAHPTCPPRYRHVPFAPARVQQQEGKSAKPRGSVNPKAVRADTPAESTLDTATLQLISDITQTVEASVSAKTALQPEQDGVATGTSDSIALRAKVDAAILKLSKGLLERETEVG